MIRSLAVLLLLPAVSAAQGGPRGVLRAEEIPASPKMKASGMAWSKDRLMIADRGGKRLVVFHPPDRFETLREIPNPGGVAVDSNGHVLVSTRDPDRLLRLHPDGDQSLTPGKVAMPHHIAVHPNGTVYITGFPDGGARQIVPGDDALMLQPRIGHTFGIALGPKRDALFITSKLPNPEHRAVWRFPIGEDGRVTGKGEVAFKTHELIPDVKDLPAALDGGKSLVGWIGRVQGLAIDSAGRFYIAGAESHTSGSAVAVIDPAGKSVLAMILDVPRNVSSLCLGGPDGRTLFIAGAGEYRLHQVRLPKD